MAVYLYDKVDVEAIKKLPFIMGSFGFAYTDSEAGKTRLGVIHEVDSVNFEKLKNLIAGKEERKIGAKDRVFVLTGCKVPLFKIKEYVRQQKAVMTDDIADATIFVGNSRGTIELTDYTNINLNSLSMFIETPYVTNESSAYPERSDKIEIDPVYEQFFPKERNEVRFIKSASNKMSEYCDFKRVGWRRMCAVTPYVMHLTYHILSKKIPTISDTCLQNQLPAAAVLDAELCERLMAMYASTDEDNHKLANEVLANCDYSNAELYLYKISRHHFYKISNSRYKNVKLFINSSLLGRFTSMSEDSFIAECVNRGTISKEILDALVPVVLMKLSMMVSNWKSNVYNIKLELRPDFDQLLGEHSYNKTIEISKSEKNDNEDTDI